MTSGEPAEHRQGAGYAYSSSAASHAHAYLLPKVMEVLSRRVPTGTAIFDLGCGNGSTAAALSKQGFHLVGVDPSEEGIAQARAAFPTLKLELGSTEDDLRARYGQFAALISLEVVEHVYAPRQFASRVADLLSPGGIALISTPYHGYLKNLSLALTGAMDRHFTALWDHGHIKFWSIRTLTRLLNEGGLEVAEVYRVGRVPPLAKSMLLVAQKPPHRGAG